MKVAAFSLALLLAPVVAHAQSEAELEAARAAFMEGVELTEQERWAEAAERFRAVIAVRATGQVKYNLGLALSHTGELVEAVALLEEAAEDRELRRATRRDARRLVEEIRPRIGSLTVRLDGDEAGVSVTVDGEPWSIERVGSAHPVDPGTHQVASRRGEQTLDAESVSVPEGGEAEVTLSVDAPPAVDEELLADVEPEPTGESNVLTEGWFWAVVGAVVVVGVGVTIGVVVATDGSVRPVSGNLDPGVLMVTP